MEMENERHLRLYSKTKLERNSKKVVGYLSDVKFFVCAYLFSPKLQVVKFDFVRLSYGTVEQRMNLVFTGKISLKLDSNSS